MNITKEELLIANELVDKFLKYKDDLPYANIGFKNEYTGWVKDFNLTNSNGEIIKLDLKQDNDLFLLFVLAVVWSRTGHWENSAFFVSYLKVNSKNTILIGWTKLILNTKKTQDLNLQKRYLVN